MKKVKDICNLLCHTMIIVFMAVPIVIFFILEEQKINLWYKLLRVIYQLSGV
jgi:hypothetical protein